MKNLIAALAAIQSEALVVVKDRKNDALKSKYANFADVTEVLRPHLKKHGLLVSFLNGKMRESGGSWVVEITIRVAHVDSGECDVHTGEVAIPDKSLSSSGREILNFAQRYGIGIAYGQRYMLVGYFSIVTGDDDDAERARSAMRERDVDAPPQVDANAHWSTLCGNTWRHVAAPDWGTLGEQSPKELSALWEKHPTHAGLIAWAADRLYDRFESMGLMWDEFRKKDGGSWPEHFNDCTPEQIRAACVAAKAMAGTVGGPKQ